MKEPNRQKIMSWHEKTHPCLRLFHLFSMLIYIYISITSELWEYNEYAYIYIYMQKLLPLHA